MRTEVPGTEDPGIGNWYETAGTPLGNRAEAHSLITQVQPEIMGHESDLLLKIFPFSSHYINVYVEMATTEQCRYASATMLLYIGQIFH